MITLGVYYKLHVVQVQYGIVTACAYCDTKQSSNNKRTFEPTVLLVV